jgi:TPP-dependent pyruvate/acetoin dehydrogenase alpha subunit
VVIQPGSLEWFRAAAQVRAAEAGLVARMVPGVSRGGYDPAAGYRSFDQAIERLVEGPTP